MAGSNTKPGSSPLLKKGGFKSNGVSGGGGVSSHNSITTSPKIGSGNKNKNDNLIYDFERQEVNFMKHAADDAASVGSSIGGSMEHKTTAMQTYIHLLKGFIGVGCLSLPWAISKLGYVGGISSIFVLSAWTSYNCWTVVKVKRYVERWQEHHVNPNPNTDTDNNEFVDETGSEQLSTTSTQLTYPDVGEWAYGSRFQTYVSACICTQQIAICTVFFSFVGENILAVCQLIPDKVPSMLLSHTGVMSTALPFVLSLSFFPHLKSLTPVMAAATVLLFSCFGVLAYIMGSVWNDRPIDEIEVKPPDIPLALCAILYSYEGICIILPVESAMEKPKQFSFVFWSAMGSVAAVMAIFGVFCVMAFGEVTNGSITAALLEAYQDSNGEGVKDDPDAKLVFVMIANTVASLSVLFTYPLMLFPALELLGPILTRWAYHFLLGVKLDQQEDNVKNEKKFEKMPSISEHRVASLHELDSSICQNQLQSEQEQQYDQQSNQEKATPNGSTTAAAAAAQGRGSFNFDDSDTASVISNVTSMFPRMDIPGDSPFVRLVLVLTTYLFAVIVPNVQALVSLAGAVAGSSTALLVPPILELAFLQHIETSGGDVASESASVRPSRRVIFGKYWGEELKCYFFVVIGFLFFVIGTYAALADIVRIWITGES